MAAAIAVLLAALASNRDLQAPWARWQAPAARAARTPRIIHAVSATARKRTPAAWHRARRARILKECPSVRSLLGRDARVLPTLAVVNALQLGCAVALGHLPVPELVLTGLLGGGTLSLWQFALLHDVKHGSALLPKGLLPDTVLFAGSMPSLFGYYLYLRYGHLSHHANVGTEPLSTLFDSEQVDFEDGDVLFVAHRQRLPRDNRVRIGFSGKDVGGLGLSISRTMYALLWSERLGWAYNLLVYSAGMCIERAALCANEKVVAVIGRNVFFPNKPGEFHETCARYARANALVHIALLVAGGPGTLVWLFCAEVGWQLPVHPACATFVSNHPSLSAADSEGGGAMCQPTCSVHAGPWYDWLCAFSNLHTEHHDFPEMSMFCLPALRDTAPNFYAAPELEGSRCDLVEIVRRSFASREFYACAGDLALVSVAKSLGDT